MRCRPADSRRGAAAVADHEDDRRRARDQRCAKKHGDAAAGKEEGIDLAGDGRGLLREAAEKLLTIRAPSRGRSRRRAATRRMMTMNEPAPSSGEHAAQRGRRSARPRCSGRSPGRSGSRRGGAGRPASRSARPTASTRPGGGRAARTRRRRSSATMRPSRREDHDAARVRELARWPRRRRSGSRSPPVSAADGVSSPVEEVPAVVGARGGGTAAR